MSIDEEQIDSVECDGCGRCGESVVVLAGGWCSYPKGWFVNLADEDTPLVACSFDCVRILNGVKPARDSAPH